MTRTYKLTLGIGLCGCTQEDEIEIELDDESSDEEWEEAADEEWHDWRNNYLDGGWELVTND